MQWSVPQVVHSLQVRSSVEKNINDLHVFVSMHGSLRRSSGFHDHIE